MDYYSEQKAKKAERQKQYRAAGITARKSGGDDSQSWAVFINGRRFVSGLSSREVPYYKDQALESQTRRQK